VDEVFGAEEHGGFLLGFDGVAVFFWWLEGFACVLGGGGIDVEIGEMADVVYVFVGHFKARLFGNVDLTGGEKCDMSFVPFARFLRVVHIHCDIGWWFLGNSSCLEIEVVVRRI